MWFFLYRQTFNISRTFVGNEIVDRSDVVEAAPASRRCSNYIFILNLTPGFNGLEQLQAETRNIVWGFGDNYIRGLRIYYYHIAIDIA